MRMEEGPMSEDEVRKICAQLVRIVFTRFSLLSG